MKVEEAELAYAFVLGKGCKLIERRSAPGSWSNWVLRFEGRDVYVEVESDRGYAGTRVGVNRSDCTGLAAVLNLLGYPIPPAYVESDEALKITARALEANWELVFRVLRDPERSRAAANNVVWTQGALAKSIRARVLAAGRALVVPPPPGDEGSR